MGTANQKSLRDGVVAGAPTSASVLILVHLGMPLELAVAVAPFGLVAWMRFYRALRAMQNPVGAFIRSMDDPAPSA